MARLHIRDARWRGAVGANGAMRVDCWIGEHQLGFSAVSVQASGPALDNLYRALRELGVEGVGDV